MKTSMVAAVILALAGGAVGQVAPDLTAFRSTRGSLEPHFRGHNIVAIADALEHSPYLKSKSEFESTSAYETRVSQFPRHPIIGKLDATSEYGFVVGKSDTSYGGYKIEYDADSSSLTFTVPQWGSSSFRMTSTTKPLGSFRATNAFGAKATIYKSIDNDFMLKLESGSVPPISITVSTEEARILKAEGRILIVCHLLPPWITLESDYHEGTMTEQWETVTYTHTLHIVPDQVWIFNQRTGRILKKVMVE